MLNLESEKPHKTIGSTLYTVARVLNVLVLVWEFVKV